MPALPHEKALGAQPEPPTGAPSSLPKPSPVKTEQARRISGLDGLRAISICLVLLSHVKSTEGFPWGSILRPLGEIGNLGVRVFFVISGFLITTLLLEEQRTHGRLSLKAFYLRRALRILPAFMVFVGTMQLADLLGYIELPSVEWLHAWTFTANYARDPSWWLAHLWSLSVEEQFYLLWPAALAFVGLHRMQRVATFLMLFGPALAYVCTRLLFPSHLAYWYRSFESVVDGLATGCVLAGARQFLDRSRLYLRFLESPAFWGVPPLMLAANAMRNHPFASALAGQLVMNVGAALLIDRAIRLPESAFSRALNTRLLAFVGTLSYSLYLWQQPFLNATGGFWFNVFPMNLALSTMAALLSYFLVETPVLRLRHALEVLAPFQAHAAARRTAAQG